jgi:predicted glycosyltransferase
MLIPNDDTLVLMGIEGDFRETPILIAAGGGFHGYCEVIEAAPDAKYKAGEIVLVPDFVVKGKQMPFKGKTYLHCKSADVIAKVEGEARTPVETFNAPGSPKNEGH